MPNVNGPCWDLPLSLQCLSCVDISLEKGIWKDYGVQLVNHIIVSVLASVGLNFDSLSQFLSTEQYKPHFILT